MSESNPEKHYEVRDRRPMAPREWGVMRWFTGRAIALGLSANAISVLSVVFALASGAAMVATNTTGGVPHRLLWLVGAAGIELRAFCNLLDGMVAVKTKTASPVGEIYNEVPDRISDIAMLAGFGWAVGSPALGMATACAAVLVAYVRAQAAAAGAGQDYCGPMAKPVRMQLIAFGCLVMVALPDEWADQLSGSNLDFVVGSFRAYGWLHMQSLLWIVLLGCVLTAGRRVIRASRRLREKAT